MKIPKAEFNKLKQGDRVEFLLKYQMASWDNLAFTIITLEIISCFFSLLFVKMNYWYALFLSGVCSVVFMILFYVVLFVSSNNQRKVKEEYFKVEVKKNEQG